MTAIQQFKSNNVSLFLNDEESGAIKSYLKTLAKNTQDNYKGRFNKYFQAITNSTIDNITWEQLSQITYTDSATYQQYLVNEGKMKNKTINETMSAISKMFNFLSIKYPQHNINPSNATLVNLFESEHENNSYGSLSEEEIYSLFSYCEKVKYKPLSQKLFFETLFITALRFDAVRTLTINNIHNILDPETKQMVYVIKTVDKSKNRTIAIPNQLALRLLDEPKNNDTVFKLDNPDRIFDFGEQAIKNTLTKFCKANNIDESRNIKLHSIKKAAVNNALTITNGNITEVAKFAGHNSANTTLKYYTDMHTNYTEQLSMRTGYDKNDMRKLDNLSRTELLELIDKAGVGTIKKLVNIMEKEDRAKW